jgi:hypothetical protein
MRMPAREHDIEQERNPMGINFTPHIKRVLSDGEEHRIAKLQARYLHLIGEEMRDERLERVRRLFPDDAQKQYEAEEWAPTVPEIVGAIDSPRWALRIFHLCLAEFDEAITRDRAERLAGGPNELISIFQEIRDTPAGPPAPEVGEPHVGAIDPETVVGSIPQPPAEANAMTVEEAIAAGELPPEAALEDPTAARIRAS